MKNIAKKMLDFTLENNHSLSITVDVEDWYHIPSVTGSPFSVYKDVDDFFEKWNGRYDYLSEPTKRVLDMLDDFDILLLVLADKSIYMQEGKNGGR